MNEADFRAWRREALVAGQGELGATAQGNTVQARYDRQGEFPNGIERCLAVNREGSGVFQITIGCQFTKVAAGCECLVARTGEYRERNRLVVGSSLENLA